MTVLKPYSKSSGVVVFTMRKKALYRLFKAKKHIIAEHFKADCFFTTLHSLGMHRLTLWPHYDPYEGCLHPLLTFDISTLVSGEKKVVVRYETAPLKTSCPIEYLTKNGFITEPIYNGLGRKFITSQTAKEISISYKTPIENQTVTEKNDKAFINHCLQCGVPSDRLLCDFCDSELPF